jgi:hypothetical protein
MSYLYLRLIMWLSESELKDILELTEWVSQVFWAILNYGLL